MRFLFKLGIVAVVVFVCFLIYWLLGYLSIIGGIIYLAVSGEDDNKKEPLYPSTKSGTNVSSAWLGAKMDEEEARRKEVEKEPRDQGH